MQGKRFTDEVVEMEAFKVDQPGGKWLVFTYYQTVSHHLGQMVKRCDDLPTEYPDFWKDKMVPIQWKRWTGESKDYRHFNADEFLQGMNRSF